MAAVAAGASGTSPVTPSVLGAPPVVSALDTLRRQGPAQQPSSTSTALSALRQLTVVAGSPYQALPATEQQVFANAGQAGGTPIAGVPLTGPTPVADYPYAGIKAAWVDDTQSRAAAAFSDYLAQPAQQKLLADKGFHAGDAALPPASPTVSFTPVTTTLGPVDAATSAAVTALLAAPAVAPAPPTSTSTVLLDVSESMSTRENGTTRLDATTGALDTRIGELPGTAGVGPVSGTPAIGVLPARPAFANTCCSVAGRAWYGLPATKVSWRRALKAVLVLVVARVLAAGCPGR